MKTRFGLPGGRALLVDAALTLACLALLVDRALLGIGVATDIGGRTAWTLPLFAVGDLALLWRRTRPVTSALLVFAPFAVQALVTGHGVEGAFALLPTLVAVYSLGAYAVGARLVVGVAGVAVLMAAHDTHDPGVRLSDQVEVWSYLFFTSVEVGVLVVGVLVGTGRRARAQRRRALEAETQRSQAIATERAKIARELHDVVTHNVNVVVMQAMAAHGVLESDPERARAPLEAIESSGREALSEMRRMLGVLREETEPMLVPQPGAADVRRMIEQVRRAGLAVSLDETGDLDGIPDGIGVVVFRIVQEALTNAMKHAAGAAVRVGLRRDVDGVTIEVRNAAGRGEAEPSGAGQGLVGMSERVALFRGQVWTGPTGDGGFSVRAVLPLEGG